MPPLSHWATYVGMVAEMTNHDADYIWSQMPIARGEQFRTLWFAKHGIECVPAYAPSPLRKRL